MMYLVITHVIFIFMVLIGANVKERKKYVEILTFIYKILKGIDILLLSLFLYRLKDLNSIFEVIPVNNISINLTVYTLLITTLINGLEECIVNSKKVSIEALISPKKLGDTFIKDNIELPSIAGEWEKAFIVLRVKGNLKTLTGSCISIKLPKSASAQVTEYFTNEDIFQFPVSDFVATDGLTSIEITLIKEDKPVVSETELEIELVSKSLIKELFMIDFSSEKCGMKEK